MILPVFLVLLVLLVLVVLLILVILLALLVRGVPIWNFWLLSISDIFISNCADTFS